MKTKWNCDVRCWIAYALLGLLLLGLFAAGNPPGNGMNLVFWIYGFPSTALLLPVASLFWTLDGPAELFATAAIAVVVNGALLYFVLHVVRDALQPDPPEILQPVRVKASRGLVRGLPVTK